MPEGDTVHKLAAVMRQDLEGRALTRLWLRDRGPIGRLAEGRVESIEALGKHLLVAIAPADGGGERWVLHVHLGMNGRWLRSAPRVPDREPGRGRVGRIVASLETRETRWLCRAAARAELLREVELALHPRLSRLGPDLLATRVDLEEIVRRARAGGSRVLAELLLDQRVACGIGNVYKNEILFLEALHPRLDAATLPDSRLRGLYERARLLMRQNLGGWPRTTTRRVAPDRPLGRSEPRSWVHDRAGQPCLRCGRRVRVARLGDAARPAFWCPGCQPAGRLPMASRSW